MAAPLDLVVRFSTANPDVVLTVEQPLSVTTLALKQRIRAELPAPANASRLRLIHAGRVLLDTAALSQTLHSTVSPPRPPAGEDGGAGKSEKAKGKLPARDTKAPALRVYIHCSIGDTLTASELAAETKGAADAEVALQSKQAAVPTALPGQDGEIATNTTPAPRGFDRLLNAGFTPAEVATLRTQFLAIQAHTHTPDTMPSGSALLELEEQWLDNSNSGPGAGTAETTNTGGFGAEDAGGLEDMLWGNLIGFFWPVGAMCWAMREEGIWTRRRQIAVLSGFLVNLTFGFLRLMN